MGNKGTKIIFDDKLRGTNVALSKGGVAASRVNKATTEHSLAFIQQEIPKGAKLQIRIDEKIKKAEGTMKIGFTTKLPKTIPSNGDDLLDTADYWTASNKTVTNFGEPREIKFDYSRLNVGDIVSIRIREDDGRICCYVNGKYKRYIDKPVTIPALRRSITSFYGFVELSGAISKVSLLPVTIPEINSRQLGGGSPQLIPKDSDHDQPRRSIKRIRDESLKRSQSIAAMITTELETAVIHNATESGESTDNDDDDNDVEVVKKRTESFKGHPVWQKRLSSSLPSGTWNDSVVMRETPKAIKRDKRRSMFAEVADLEVSNFISIDSDDYTDHDEPTLFARASKGLVKEEEITLPLPAVLQDFLIPWGDLEFDTDDHTAYSDGAFAKSYASRWMKAECLVTQYKREIFSDPVLFAKCQKLVKLRHPNLLQLLGFTRESENSSLLVINEKLSATLDVVLKRRSTSELLIGPKLTIASDVVKALCYLHQQSPPLVHCAIVPTNIYLTAYYSAKLSDTGFGEAAITSQALSPSLSRYLPIEAITDVPTLSPSLDIFTFGVTLFQMVTHKEPSNFPANNKASESQRLLEYIELIGEDHLLADLIKQCLRVEPKDRPSAVELYNLLQAVNISLLES